MTKLMLALALTAGVTANVFADEMLTAAADETVNGYEATTKADMAADANAHGVEVSTMAQAGVSGTTVSDTASMKAEEKKEEKAEMKAEAPAKAHGHKAH